MRYISLVLTSTTTARRTAALVNVLSQETTTPDAVAAVLREHGETGPIDLTPADLTAMRTAAGALREVFAAPDTDTAAEALNRLLRKSTGRLRLTAHHGTTPWHPHLDSNDDAPWGEWLLAASCLALAVLIWDGQRPPGGICASTACENVYLTQGSGPPRRFCSRRCATRERVAAHRRRQ
ncbi:CGNR zinc finger domain-containing protein [Streptomyces beijiangensis]|uniref:CGNR zinc finger domain-containing protein n=1 Tax=Streptomyces beijiangensis TaxID=163361 RepID=A0A939F9T4_9ACTN|nr:CGNR zinc finger domain-containing protein [Streptomyces beijiangensis]MBO0514163.1 CGNR zinc finger domain-containing protein [Streptomyces beijiangensis]